MSTLGDFLRSRTPTGRLASLRAHVHALPPGGDAEERDAVADLAAWLDAIDDLIKAGTAPSKVLTMLERARGDLLAIRLSRFQGRGRGAGPVKRLVRKVLPKLEKHLKRKASHAEVWAACAVAGRKPMEFYSSGTPDYIWVGDDHPSTSWATFRKIVSEVRAEAKVRG